MSKLSIKCVIIAKPKSSLFEDCAICSRRVYSQGARGKGLFTRLHCVSRELLGLKA